MPGSSMEHLDAIYNSRASAAAAGNRPEEAIKANSSESRKLSRRAESTAANC